MLIALPLEGETLAQHFGHCEKFAPIDVNPASSDITRSWEVAAPEHQPGLLPSWLKEQGVSVVIAGGMGARAQTLFQSVSIEVLTGAPSESPNTLVQRYLTGALISTPKTCDHHGCNH